MELIFGGTGSGKSAFGEERATGFTGRKLYLATMSLDGGMAEERIARHRLMRQGKGFETVECSRDVGALSFDLLREEQRESVILLECLGTLLANEMYAPSAVNWALLPLERETQANQSNIEEKIVQMVTPVVEKIFSDILTLSLCCGQLIVISSDVFGEKGDYSVETRAYLCALGLLHRKLVDISATVWELVYGIPILWKGSEENSGTGDKT